MVEKEEIHFYKTQMFKNNRLKVFYFSKQCLLTPEVFTKY